jgi:hypothetical protein
VTTWIIEYKLIPPPNSFTFTLYGDPKMARPLRSSNLADYDSTPLSVTPSDIDQLPASIPPYSVIGVSISRAQTRLASPTTPAAEKAAAINDGGGYFHLPPSWEESNESPPISSDQSLPISQPDTLKEVGLLLCTSIFKLMLYSIVHEQFARVPLPVR